MVSSRAASAEGVRRPGSFFRVGIVSQYALVLSLFALVPLATTLLLGVWATERLVARSVEREFESVVSLKLAQARARASRRADDVRRLAREGARLADLPEFSVARPAAEPLSPGTAALITEWLRGQERGLGDGVSLYLVALDGWELARDEPSKSAEQWAGRAGIVDGRHRTWSAAPGLGEPGEPTLVTVATPFRTTAGRTVAELVLRERGEVLERWLELDTDISAEVALRDFAGRVVARWPPGDLNRPPPPPRASITASVGVQPGGGELSISAPRELALGDLIVLRNLGIGLLVFGLAITLATAALLGRAMASPLTRLSAAARRIGAGDLTPFPLSHRPDEIGDLYRSADAMRLALERSRSRLEALLAERSGALARREELVTSLFGVLPQFVVTIDEAFVIRSANQTARRLHGASPVGQTCHGVIYGLDRPCEGCPRDLPEATDEFESPLSNRFSEVMTFRLVSLATPSSPSPEWLYTGRLITEQRRLRAQVLHQEKMATIGLLAAGVAHEIGNPLASLLSILQLPAGPKGGASAEQVSLLSEQVARIGSVVEDLLGAARRTTLDAGPLLVNQVVRRAAQLVRYDPRCAPGAIEVECDPDLPMAWGAEDRLLQAILNLLINALDAVDGAGDARIRVVTRHEGGSVRVEIDDNGPGMEAAVLAQAFDPLFTTKPPGRGTGLGLHISRQVLADLGGELRLSSEPGVGTSAVLQLPSGRPGATRMKAIR